MTSATEDRDTFVLPRPRRASVRLLPDAAQPDVPVRRPPTQHGESPHGESPSTAPSELLGRVGAGRVRAPATQRGLPGRAELVLRLVLEVVAGRRPPAQLHGMVTRRVLRYVAAEATRPPAHDRAPRRLSRMAEVRQPQLGSSTGPGLRSMRICHPVDEVAEVSAVWRYHNRVRALAARFELVPTAPDTAPQWRCTVLRIGW
jgi:hypothetical protein